MVDLGPKFPTNFEGVPPHVSSEDYVLWEEWRKRHASEFVAFYFDVAIGSGEESAANVPAKVAEAWKRLTRFRADVVADTGTAWLLIELRPNAGPGAVGAVQTYLTLWHVGPPDDRPVVGRIVTDRCSVDISRVASLAGISLECLHG